MLPTIAIVGRPNVGKSTLFNRLVGKKLALVDDQPGVTRDRREGQANLLGIDFTIIDTAGYEDEDPQTLPGRMRMQTQAAVENADVALFVVDARAGVTPLDEEIARWLREGDAPVVLMANKAEGKAGDDGVMEAFSLGLGDPIPFSPNMVRAWPTFSRLSCPISTARKRRRRPNPMKPTSNPHRSNWPLSAAPTRASRPSSIACWAKTAC